RDKEHKRLSKEESEKLIKSFIEEEKRIRAEEKALEEEEVRARIYQQRRIRMKELQRKEIILQLKRAARKTWKYTKVTAAAAVLVFFVYIGYLLMQPGSVATLTDTANAEWENPDFSGKLESRLLPGPMNLKKGLAQITFDDGAEIIIEAPAKINLKKSNQAYLELGRLSAKVPPHAEGFTINTPSASIIDLGTEFAIQVNAKGSSDVRVVKGKAGLATQLKGVTGKITQIVTAGQAKRVRYGYAVIESIRPETVAYIETIQPKIIADTKSVPSDHKPVSKSILEIPTLTYSQTILKYKPVLYFPFDNMDNQHVINRVNNKQTGQLIGQASIANTDVIDGSTNNRALELNGGCLYIEDFKDKGSHDGYTFIIRIRPEIIDSQQQFLQHILSAKKGPYDDSLMLELYMTENGTLNLFTDSTEYLKEEEDLSLDVFDIVLEAGFSFHLAAVVSPGYAQLYINGTLREERWKMPAKMASELLSESKWNLLIGASKLKRRQEAPLIDEGFRGTIDEFAMYDRVLSRDEITTLYLNSKNGN
ncbi:MAG: LamG-like jellyroll fold domain-containing protein, partial [Planctomycetota bacterium]